MDSFPSIYDAANFSAFFASYMRARKAKDRRFSYERLCRRTGVRSTSILHDIVTARRLPSIDVVVQLCIYIGLDEREIDFALVMVLRDRSKNEQVRRYFSRRLANSLRRWGSSASS